MRCSIRTVRSSVFKPLLLIPSTISLNEEIICGSFIETVPLSPAGTSKVIGSTTSFPYIFKNLLQCF